MEFIGLSPDLVRVQPIEGKGRGVVALVDIPKNTIISVEKCLRGTPTELLEQMKIDPFVKKMCPEQGNLHDKLFTNAFGGDILTLAPFTSYYNHNCAFNTMYCMLGLADVDLDGVVSQTTKDIKAGEELCIMYHPDMRHEGEPYKHILHQDYICRCGFSKEKRQELWKFTHTDDFHNLKDNPIFDSILRFYLRERKTQNITHIKEGMDSLLPLLQFDDEGNVITYDGKSKDKCNPLLIFVLGQYHEYRKREHLIRRDLQTFLDENKSNK